MQIEQLREFLVLADSESISHAARRLFVAQSALSTRLKALERELGTTLIERDYHQYRLTAAGEALLTYARQICNTADRARQSVSDTVSGKRGTLRIAVTPSIATSLFLHFLQRYHALYPDVDFRVLECPPPEVLERIKDGVADVGIARLPLPAGNELHTDTLTGDRLVVAYCPTALQPPDVWRMQDLARYPLITLHRYRGMLDALPQAADVTLHYVAECSQISTVLALASIGLGVAIVPYTAHQHYRPTQGSLACGELSDVQFDTRCVLLRALSRPLPPTADNFVKMCLQDLPASDSPRTLAPHTSV